MILNTSKIIINDYSNYYEVYADCCHKIEKLICELLRENNIKFQSITSRVKEKDSLEKKVENSDGKYQSITDITDIIGIRIITYFEDEVDMVAQIIKDEFEIDNENSIDKRKLLDPDRFGYLSLHYVVNISPIRLKLLEYRKFSKCKIEIQIRSILQHTWAEIEHDLGYKSNIAVPRDIRRSFSRIAGLLELADQEFTRIRNELLKYEQEVEIEIINSPENVLIDITSLRKYIQSSSIVNELDQAIASIVKGNISDKFLEESVEGRLNGLAFLNIKTIAKLESLLKNHKSNIIKFADLFLNKNREDKAYEFTQGVSIFYLCYVLLSFTKSQSKIIDYLHLCKIGGTKSDKHKKLADSLIDINKHLLNIN